MLTNELLVKLTPMIGFRDEPGIEPLSGPLKETTTGLTVDQCHELLTLSVLTACTPKQDSALDRDAFLTRCRQDAIRTLLTTLDTRLAEAGLAARLLRSTQFFTPTPSPVAIDPVINRVVGLRLTAIRDDVTLTIERLQVFATYPNDFKLTLTDEYTGTDQEITPGASSKWADVSVTLFAGRSYLLTYPENDLAGDAFNTVASWPKTKKGCSTCIKKCPSHYLKVVPVTKTGDVVTETTNTNFGINFVLSASGDLSGLLLDDPSRLLPALKAQIAVSFLEKVANSRQLNGQSEDAIQTALFWLTDKDNADRYPVRLEKAIKTLVEALAKEASPALDVDDTDEITWGSL